MKRRSFVKLIAGVSILSVSGYAVAPSFESIVKTMIGESIKDLILKRDQIDKFITEATEEKYWSQFSRSKQEFIKIHYLTANSIVNLPYGNKYRQYRNEIVGRFLLSTDFFIHNMESGREINYVRFYNPYKMPCSNPFSSVYYQV